MKNQTPFLDVQSFVMEEESRDTPATSVPVSSPFLSLYEFEEGDGLIDPEAEKYVAFLNELYDEEFDEALSGLVNEATAIYETQSLYEQEGPQTAGYQAERLLNQHFAPLVAETDAMFEALARELSQHDPNFLTEDEIETIVDRYQPSVELTPNFEEFLDKLKKGITKVAKIATKLHPIGIILKKLKPLIKPLLKRVIQMAIGKLPPHLQPIARKLAESLPFLKKRKKRGGAVSAPTGHAAAPAEPVSVPAEPVSVPDEPVSEPDEPASAPAEPSDVSEIQYEFNRHVADLLFAHTEVEQDLEVARILTEQKTHDNYPLAELDRARGQFIEKLSRLKEGEDPTPHVENFLPAILPALKMGIRIIGRKRVVNFLAGLLGKLIGKLVGPQYAHPLSRAIVDVGLKFLTLETAPVEASDIAAEAVATTVEETVQRVAALPNYVLDNQELLEGFALEAFEQAAAVNLPPGLPEETYRKRPDLREAGKLRGLWVMMPRGGRRRYKKFSRKILTRFTPHKVATLDTFDGIPVEEFLEGQLGIAPGEEVEAFVHLYEAIPGTRLYDIARQEKNIAKMNTTNGHCQFHPLTRDAATLLLGEPELGRDADPRSVSDPHAPLVGQRFYYLEIPGKRLFMSPQPAGRTKGRRPTRTRLILDFPKNEIRVYLFLSEIRAQEVAVKLRQRAHIGTVMAHLRRFIERGLRNALKGAFGSLKIVHEAVTPDQWMGALRGLPTLVPQALLRQLTEWVVKGLVNHLKQRPDDFIKAAEDTADGVTLMISLENPPGFTQLRQALKGNGSSLASLKLSDGVPIIKITIAPGYTHE